MRYLIHPAVASLLLLAGIAGLYIEFSSPGGFVFGLLGAVCLVLAAYGLGYLPFNSFGLVLMISGVVLMGAELFLPAFGLVFLAGVVCLGIGAYMLFDVPEIGDMAPPFWTTILLSVTSSTGPVTWYAQVVPANARAAAATRARMAYMVFSSSVGLRLRSAVTFRLTYWCTAPCRSHAH